MKSRKIIQNNQKVEMAPMWWQIEKIWGTFNDLCLVRLHSLLRLFQWMSSLEKKGKTLSFSHHCSLSQTLSQTHGYHELPLRSTTWSNLLSGKEKERREVGGMTMLHLVLWHLCAPHFCYMYDQNSCVVMQQCQCDLHCIPWGSLAYLEVRGTNILSPG